MSPWKANDSSTGAVTRKLPHGRAAHDLQGSQRRVGDYNRSEEAAAPQAEVLERPTAGHDVSDRLVCDVGVADGERVETREPGCARRDGAEAEPAEREGRQQVLGHEQVAGEFNERRAFVNGAPFVGGGVRSTCTSLAPLATADATNASVPLVPCAGDVRTTQNTSSSAPCSAWSRRQQLTVGAAAARDDACWPRVKSRSVKSRLRTRPTREEASARERRRGRRFTRCQVTFRAQICA